MNSRRAIVIFAGAVLAACTTIQNWTQQDLVWSAYNQCKAEGRIPSNVQLVHVESDGRARYSTYSSAYGAQEFERCITEKISSSSAGIPTPTDAPILSPAVSCPDNTNWNGQSCTSP